jgi:aspartyl-tRNA(Asn)/glutamyl-tRNA(Gln) amidotransferase subunit A
VRGGDEPVRNAMLRLTQPFNLGRQPAVSLPCGLTTQGLPVGLQLVGPFGHTLQLLQLAAACERVLPES